MLDPSELADEAVICYNEGDRSGYFRFCDELSLCGLSAREVAKLLADAGLPQQEDLKRSSETSDLRQPAGIPSAA